MLNTSDNLIIQINEGPVNINLQERRSSDMEGARIAVIVVANIVISNNQSKEFDSKLDKELAVMKTEFKNLTEEVKKHNGFAEKIPRLEFEIQALKERIDKMEKTPKAS